jgi:uncharacterized protein (TIGR02246 family)
MLGMMQDTLDSPADVSNVFVQAINAGNVQRAVDLYREDAVLLSPDGSEARGAAAIRQLLENVISMEVEMTSEVRSVVVVGDFAVAAEDWTMRLHTLDSQPSEQRGRSTVCFARGADGWRFVIDAPWGLGQMT